MICGTGCVQCVANFVFGGHPTNRFAIPITLLGLTSAAVVLYAADRSLLESGLPGASFAIVAMWSVIAATFHLLFALRGGAGALRAVPAGSLACHLVAAVVCSALFAALHPGTPERGALLLAGPLVGALLFAITIVLHGRPSVLHRALTRGRMNPVDATRPGLTR